MDQHPEDRLWTYAAYLRLPCTADRYLMPCWKPLSMFAASCGRGLCSARNFGKSSAPKAQPFTQRRAKPWYIGRTACYIQQRFAVFGPTGQEFAGLRLPEGSLCHNPCANLVAQHLQDVCEEMFRMLSHPAQDKLLARWAGSYREQKGILVGPLYQGFALRWAN
jgi:hypothetical protein